MFLCEQFHCLFENTLSIHKIPLNEGGCSSRQKSELKLEIDATFLEKRFPNGLEMSFDARCDI